MEQHRGTTHSDTLDALHNTRYAAPHVDSDDVSVGDATAAPRLPQDPCIEYPHLRYTTSMKITREQFDEMMRWLERPAPRQPSLMDRRPWGLGFERIAHILFVSMGLVLMAALTVWFVAHVYCRVLGLT